MQRFIEASSSEANPGETMEAVGHRSVYRSSRLSLTNWQRRLTPQEVERIRQHVEPTAHHFYDDTEWLMRSVESDVISM
jgi:hypothetical protein